MRGKNSQNYTKSTFVTKITCLRVRFSACIIVTPLCAKPACHIKSGIFRVMITHYLTPLSVSFLKQFFLFSSIFHAK